MEPNIKIENNTTYIKEEVIITETSDYNEDKKSKDFNSINNPPEAPAPSIKEEERPEESVSTPPSADLERTVRALRARLDLLKLSLGNLETSIPSTSSAVAGARERLSLCSSYMETLGDKRNSGALTRDTMCHAMDYVSLEVGSVKGDLASLADSGLSGVIAEMDGIVAFVNCRVGEPATCQVDGAIGAGFAERIKDEIKTEVLDIPPDSIDVEDTTAENVTTMKSEPIENEVTTIDKPLGVQVPANINIVNSDTVHTYEKTAEIVTILKSELIEKERPHIEQPLCVQVPANGNIINSESGIRITELTLSTPMTDRIENDCIKNAIINDHSSNCLGSTFGSLDSIDDVAIMKSELIENERTHIGKPLGVQVPANVNIVNSEPRIRIVQLPLATPPTDRTENNLIKNENLCAYGRSGEEINYQSLSYLGSLDDSRALLPRFEFVDLNQQRFTDSGQILDSSLNMSENFLPAPTSSQTFSSTQALGTIHTASQLQIVEPINLTTSKIILGNEIINSVPQNTITTLNFCLRPLPSADTTGNSTIAKVDASFRANTNERLANKKIPRTAAERARDYRARQKNFNLLTKPPSIKTLKTPAEISKNYRETQKILNLDLSSQSSEEILKIAAEYAKAYRDRQKLLRLSTQSITDQSDRKRQPVKNHAKILRKPKRNTYGPKITKNKIDSLSTTTILVCQSCNATKKSTYNRAKIPCESCHRRMQFRCLKCETLLTDSVGRVYRHMKSKCGQTSPYRCDHCDYRCSGKFSIRRHILAKHRVDSDEDQALECAKCGEKFKSKKSMLKHRQACVLGLCYKCELCSFETRLKRYLRAHLERLHKHLTPKKMTKIIGRAVPREPAPKSTKNKNSDPAKFSFKAHVKPYCSKCDIDLGEPHPEDRKCPRCDTLTHFQCLKCDRRYLNSASMLAHLKSKCGSKESYKCEHCDYQVSWKQLLRYHLEAVHTIVAPEDYMQCERCGMRFKHRLYLVRHQRLCGKEPFLHCEFCPYKGKNKAYFKRHMQNHILHEENHGAEGRADAVGRTTDNGVAIQDATSKPGTSTTPCVMRRVTKAEQSKIEQQIKSYCARCHRSTQNAKGKRKCPRCSTPFLNQCNKCDGKYRLRSELRRHMVNEHLVHETKGDAPSCTKCGKKFALFASLGQHEANCGREPKFECHHCGFKSKYKGNLAEHMKRRHPEIANMPSRVCRGCGKKYVGAMALASHKQFCSSKQPTLACDHCCYRTRTKAQILVHLHRVHMGLFTKEELKCKVCGKKSSNVYSHSVHKKNCGVTRWA